MFNASGLLLLESGRTECARRVAYDQLLPPVLESYASIRPNQSEDLLWLLIEIPKMSLALLCVLEELA
jgi:hypothetical protein